MHYYKLLGNKESHKELWENKEALDKYIARLKEFWNEDEQRWLTDEEIKNKNNEQRNTTQKQA